MVIYRFYDHQRSGRKHIINNINTAVLLAAGIGKRLAPLTNNTPKCLTKVNGKPILDHLIQCLHKYKFKRLIVVLGYLDNIIRDHLEKIRGNICVEYVINPKYRTTNNIYSLCLAKDKIKHPFILFENDLVFSPSLIEDMLKPDRIAISHILPWMNGTTVTIDSNCPSFVTALNTGPYKKSLIKSYKTVNIYSFSLQTWEKIQNRMDWYISGGNVNSYYEIVFADLISEGSIKFQCVFFDKNRWYEIDTINDLHECELMLQQTNTTILPFIKKKGLQSPVRYE